MGTVFLHGNGGSGGSGGGLGLQIVGNPKPKNPVEGIVWVNTDVDITGYFLSAEQPENLAEGNIWIRISDSSSIKVGTPLDKDYITIMLNSVSQYIGGAWVNVEAKSFQNGVWVDWFIYLINAGKDNSGVTGGWQAIGKPYQDLHKAYTPQITQNVDSITLLVPTTNTGVWRGGIYITAEKIDLTKASRIFCKCSSESDTSGGAHTYLKVWSSIGTFIDTNSVASVCIDSAGVTKEFALDVSNLTGEYFVGFSLQTAGYTDSYITVNEVYHREG